jgi:DNA/RNA-binding domain of Phe-tRNA-synthetase-like protein
MAEELANPEFDAIEGYLLGKAVQYLESGEYDGDAIHHAMFDIPKSHGVEPGKFFRALYLALIKQERGPRAGNFIKLLGQQTAADLIKERLLAPPAPQEAKPTGTLIPLMIAPEVKNRYSELRVGVAVIEGVKVSNKRPDELNKLIYQAVQAVTGGDKEYNARVEQGAIGAYRALFQTFGVNPSAMLPSPANILRMAMYDKRLPAVNNVVDASNLTVLETGISVALYDLAQLSLPLTLRLAQEGDSHLPLGSKQYESVKMGELVYADDLEVICRALNHRDSDKTKVTLKTERLLLIVDGAPGISAEALLAALQQNISRIQTYAGGTVSSQTLLL